MYSNNNNSDLWMALGEMFLIGSASYAGTITANQTIERERKAVAAQQQQQTNTELQRLNWQVNYWREQYHAKEAVRKETDDMLVKICEGAQQLLDEKEELIKENKRLRKLAKKNKKQKKEKQ